MEGKRERKRRREESGHRVMREVRGEERRGEEDIQARRQ